jgi:molybdopterin molybdotransferase
MISIEAAQTIVLANLPEPKTERVGFQDAIGRVPAEDLLATRDIPPFNRSSMDGYAVRSTSIGRIPVRLELAGELKAGSDSGSAMGPGQAFAIMTGAPVPEGADAVLALENAERSPDGRHVTLLQPVRAGENIVPTGSEATSGDIVVPAGQVVGPAGVAVMATFGHREVKVWKRPRVAVLATGDELVEVDQSPSPHQIRNSNSYSLIGQLHLLGVEAVPLGIARDNREDLRRLILQGLESDVLILTGGVSMGAYDLAKGIIQELGLTILFSKVAMKPGKPTVFARKEDKLVFGLPGNPVATFVAFENFVRPALGRLCGRKHPELHRIQGELLADMKQTPGRAAYLPAWVVWAPGGWQIQPLPWKGSADIIGFSRANATVIFPGDRAVMSRGEKAEAMLLPDFFSLYR